MTPGYTNLLSPLLDAVESQPRKIAVKLPPKHNSHIEEDTDTPYDSLSATELKQLLIARDEEIRDLIREGRRRLREKEETFTPQLTELERKLTTARDTIGKQQVVIDDLNGKLVEANGKLTRAKEAGIHTAGANSILLELVKGGFTVPTAPSAPLLPPAPPAAPRREALKCFECKIVPYTYIEGMCRNEKCPNYLKPASNHATNSRSRHMQ